MDQWLLKMCLLLNQFQTEGCYKAASAASAQYGIRATYDLTQHVIEHEAYHLVDRTYLYSAAAAGFIGVSVSQHRCQVSAPLFDRYSVNADTASNSYRLDWTLHW